MKEDKNQDYEEDLIIEDLEDEDLTIEDLEDEDLTIEDLEDEDLTIEDLADEEVPEEESAEEDIAPKKSGHRFSLHYIFFIVLAVIVIIAGVRLAIWNVGTEDDTDVSINNPEFDIESLDYIIPLNPSLLAGREDDGVTTVVCFGNAPFADDRNSKNNLANLIEKELGEDAVVYNCSVAGSYMSALKPSFTQDYPYDAFSFYWLTTTFTVDNMAILDTALAGMETVPEDVKESVDLLKSIDFDKVDVIAVMYDGSDYLDARKTINTDNPTDIEYYTGSLTAAIQLIQNIYPHIRIMVMSPTYAYALDENGAYASSDLVDYGMGSLSTYAILESNVCYENSVSFIDNIYASVNENNATDYLVDNLHLNEKARKLLARRFAECLNLYHGVAAENADE